MTAATSADGSLTVASTGRTVQMAVRAAALRETTRLWPLLDPANLDKTWPGWLAAMQNLIRNYHGQSSAAAGRTYLQARLHTLQEPAPSGLVKQAPPPSPEWVARALGYAAPGMLQRDTARPRTALTTTLGTTARIVLDGGRTTTAQTVHDDPEAVGWYRVTDGAPCAFCALMASRGVVYKTEQSSGRNANRRFDGDGEFKFHNDCGCSAAPAFHRNQPLPAVSLTARSVYRQRGTGPALQAFRQAWDAHIAQQSA